MPPARDSGQRFSHRREDSRLTSVHTCEFRGVVSHTELEAGMYCVSLSIDPMTQCIGVPGTT